MTSRNNPQRNANITNVKKAVKAVPVRNNTEHGVEGDSGEDRGMKIEKFQFPSNWKVGPIADAFDFTGKPRGLDLSKNGDEIPFFPMDQIPLGRIHVSEFTPKPLAKLGSGTYVENGDLMVAKITPSFENGKQAIVNIETDFAYATTEVIPMRGRKSESDTLFLFFYLLHPEVRSDLAGKMEGSTGRQRLSKTVIGDRVIPLPPLPEQQKIAHILSTVQRAIEAQDRIIQTTTELFKSMLHQLMTAQISVSNGDRIEGASGGGRDMRVVETEIGTIAPDWKVVPLKGLADKPQYGLTAKAAKFGDTQFLRITDITDQGVKWSTVPFCSAPKKKIDTCRLKSGDIVFARIGATTGKSYMISDPPDAVFASYLIRVRAGDDLEPGFLIQFFQSRGYWQQVDANKHTNLKKGVNGSILSELLIPLPPLPEQKKIAHILSTIQQKIDNAQSKKSKLQDIFRTLLHELMTAKIRVHEYKF